MRIYLIGGKAFAEVAKDYLISIGTAEEIKKLSQPEIYQLVQSVLETKREEPQEEGD